MKNVYLWMFVAFLFLIAVNELVRPWVYVNDRNSVKRPAGYHLIWNSPKVKQASEMKKLFYLNGDASDHKYYVKQDALALNLQRVLIFTLFLTFFLYFSSRKMIVRLLTALSAMCFIFFVYLFITTFRY